MDTDIFFKDKTPNAKKLLCFGFRQEQDGWRLRLPVADGALFLTLFISPRGDVRTRVTDVDTEEEYILYLVDEAQGTFVGDVRKDVETALRTVAETCFDRTASFDGGDAAAVLDYAREKYGGQPEFLWDRTPDSFILRRKDNGKWYAVFMTIAKNKLGDFPEDPIGVLNVKAPPADVGALSDGERFFPARHMNKRHWLSIPLDGTVPCGEIFKRLDVSFREAGKK